VGSHLANVIGRTWSDTPAPQRARATETAFAAAVRELAAAAHPSASE
jgi:hypothetical protein